jgi:hypothetical protein
MSANDKQVGGDHYAGSTQHWDIVYSVFNGDYLVGNATKYLARLGKKGDPIEDIDKAIHYLMKKREVLIAMSADGSEPTSGYINQD